MHVAGHHRIIASSHHRIIEQIKSEKANLGPGLVEEGGATYLVFSSSFRWRSSEAVLSRLFWKCALSARIEPGIASERWTGDTYPRVTRIDIT